jgi:hydroxyjasmonate sulfotransferase
MLVSMWHFARRVQPDLPLAELFEAACDGSCLSGPIWDHVLGYWNASMASPDTVLFLRSEEMLRDPAGNVRKIASFVGQPFSAAEETAGAVTDVVRLCGFKAMRSLKVNRTGTGTIASSFTNATHFRKGEARDWANHVRPEMAAWLDAVIAERLRGSGLSFT